MKKYYFIGGAGALVVLISLYFIFWRSESSPYEFIVAQKGDLVQQVSVTGRVKPAEDVDLAFEKSGRVARVYVEVGDRVSKGQILVQLEGDDVLAQLEGAEAVLKAERAKLEELKKGTRIEEIEIQKVKVENARATLVDAQKNLADKQQDAYTKSDDAVRNKVDQFFSNPRSNNPQLNFSSTNFSFETRVETQREAIENILTNWEPLFAKSNLNQIKTFLEDVALLINSLVASSDLSQTTIDGWKSDVSTARTNVNTAIVNLTAAEEKLGSSQSALTLAEEELALKKAGVVVEQITVQEAAVEKASADVKKLQADFGKTLIRSPINGIVTKQEASVGEIVSANSSLVSIISESNFEIESDIPEVDVAKIELGDEAEVTLDAYGDDILFSAVVAAIDPAETIIEGVPSYTTTLQFKEDDDRIRSGMTANLDILTEKRVDVVIIPQRAVITKNGNKFVRVLDGERVVEKEVKTGLRNSYGEIEIIEGISAGEKVITFIREK